MKIFSVISFLESMADPSLQEQYDNAGLITGDPGWECSGILCSLDATEEVIDEAISKKCNMVVAHHPIVFSGLKKITGGNYVERTIIKAIRNEVAIFAIHTNIDNVIDGVSGKMAQLLGLTNITVLAPKENTLKKLFTFVPLDHAQKVRDAIFEAGGGQIGQYSECSFNSDGTGTFRGSDQANPYVGKPGELQQEPETRVEIIFPGYLQKRIIQAMKAAHPYEEVAYDIVSLSNAHPGIGAGAIGELPESLSEAAFLEVLRGLFHLPVIRHTPFTGQLVKRVALCGGAGSFLISKALARDAQVYITGDIKYHEFFDNNGKMMIADIGHFESEQFTINLLQELLAGKFPTFAVLKTEVNTNPVNYFF
jgi:dinuclear metal center YbgI/SA1388 family protein